MRPVAVPPMDGRAAVPLSQRRFPHGWSTPASGSTGPAPRPPDLVDWLGQRAALVVSDQEPGSTARRFGRVGGALGHELRDVAASVHRTEFKRIHGPALPLRDWRISQGTTKSELEAALLAIEGSHRHHSRERQRLRPSVRSDDTCPILRYSIESGGRPFARPPQIE
jgi:hypothetical protein